MIYDNNLTLNNFNSPQTSIAENDSKNYTLIEINSKKYAIETQHVLEIIKVVEMDYSYQMPSYVIGLIEFKQNPIAVLDLREIFKKERVIYGLSAKIVIIKIKEQVLSIICDKVCDIKKIKNYRISPIPYQNELTFFDGIYSENNENIYILNINNILNYAQENNKLFKPNQNNIKYLINDENAQKILKNRKNSLLKISSEAQNSKALYDKGVTFCINNVKYYINMASVKEFYKVNNSKFIKIPNTKDYIYGLVNIKGEYITVLDLRRFFNYPKTQIKEKSTIIILNSKEYKIGILADEICESMDVDFEELIQNKLHNQDENKTMEFVKDNEIYQILDIEKLLQDTRLTIA